ncbi:Putative pre-rRNA-processing protein Esf1 [Septoria linicola]|uniref:Pre-rRNA-processing protein Esf1 n=1 Tax=Septoria linicola TaxID=215465 RepID=A0A9Q9AXK3_9PEZI|nr:Putative pre-rRNA-processing protein Esf1 [Septoria linicola]
MSDSRFDALQKDPRYRLPSRKEARTSVDPRFKTLFTDQEFRKKATVDRYGRKVKPEQGKKDLERLYRLDKKAKPEQKQEREVVGSSDEEESGSSDSGDGEDQTTAKRDPARDGGFDESSSSEEDSSDEDGSDVEAAGDDDEADLADATAGQEQTEDIPMGEVTKRIACVNLDWDNIRAADILAVASSFLPASGKVESVVIYPSEFGRERLEREEVEGPPREIFASSKRQEQDEESEEEEDDEDSESEDDEKVKERLLKQQASEGEEFDTAKLRQYQLERLRYYYAVIECSDPGTAKMLYDAMDGREYLSTSNFFDLRFVPDDTSFEDDEVHDECLQLPQGYKPNDFRTEALTHSKVQLTWDQDDATRKEVQKRAFSRAEMDDNDMQAYIGSDDSDADSTSSRMSVAEKKKAAKRANLRAALGLGAEPTKSSKDDKEVVGEMQITFTSGLSNADGKNKGAVFENEPQDEESTRQRYIRKEKERKQKRKERAKTRGNGETVDSDAEDEPAEAAIDGEQADSEDDDPFNDPFFNDPALAAKNEKAAKKAERDAKRAAKEAAAAEAEGRKAELELLMAGEDGAGKHFDMRDIEKAEKLARKKGKHIKKKDKKGDAEVDDFKVETEDPRFAALFESHEYAIDPTNPKFKKTKGMETLLEEGRKKRKGRHNEEEDDGNAAPKESRKKVKAEQKGADAGDDVKGLVARLKSKGKKK